MKLIVGLGRSGGEFLQKSLGKGMVGELVSLLVIDDPLDEDLKVFGDDLGVGMIVS